MNLLPQPAARVSRHELALDRFIWLAQGGTFAFLTVITLVCAFAPLGLDLDRTRMLLFAGVLGLVAVALLLNEPPPIGTVENHLVLAVTYVCTGLGMVAFHPHAAAAAAATMFCGSLMTIRLIDRREIAAHLLAATACVLTPALLSGLTVLSILGVAAMLVAMWVLAACCTIVVEAAEAQSEQLEELVRRDPLTGLGNRRVLTELLPIEIARHARTRRPLSIIVIDLDGFKALNDTVGHAAGDALLQRVASGLLEVSRPQDTVIRQGGDEFCVLLPNTPPELAERAAAGVRAAIAAAGEGVTGSMGTASYPRDAVHDKVLMHVADERLLEQKAKRRAAAATAAGDATRAPDDEVGSA